MPVKIRLTRMGKKKQPTYRVVVMDSRKPRDGAYIEQIGLYDPRQDPSLVEIDNERALDWLEKGAQPTERAQKLLEISGVWTAFRVSKGEIHTIGTESVDEPVEAEPASAPPVAPDHEPEIHVVGGDAAPDEQVEPGAGVTPEDGFEDIERAAANEVTETGSEFVPEEDAEV